MNDYTFDCDTVSDLHKDAYGMRPGQYFWAEWDAADDAGRQRIWDSLLDSAEASAREDERREAAAIVRFESLVDTTVAAGARNRETALRWIMDASTCGGDWEFLCWEHGLPYGYFKKVA